MWLICAVLAAVASGRRASFVWLFAIAATAATAALASGSTGRRWSGRLFRAAETTVWAAGVIMTGGSHSPLLVYILAPGFAAGLAAGLEDAIATPALGAVVLAVGRALASPPTEPLSGLATSAAEWLVLALVAGLLASWIRKLIQETASHDAQESYLSAYRLLSQLRTVSRQLSAGLDATTLAEGMLRSLQDVMPYDRGAVFVRSSGTRLVPLAYTGADRVDWDVDLVGDTAFADAWMSQRAQSRNWQHSGGRGVSRSGSSIVLPLRMGLRTFGLVGLETREPDAFPPHAVAAAEPILANSALRLETALLFNDVREVATAEERRRLAREIHDGIAQELASLGYFIDGLHSEAAAEGSGVAEPLSDLRKELSRIISELRLSIFDLRSDVDQHGGLGAALSEYVRTVGTTSPFTVHLSLDERPTRLPAETEAELLRIAQEAITNARKHADAENLWVDCMVDPPRATLRVADDGSGMRRGRQDSFGLDVMRERAARLHAQFRITPREPTGTVVEVTLGGDVETDTVSENDARQRGRAS
jgi:signal transduction histidine kinase